MDFFFFNDTATTEIYPLSLHDALPIYGGVQPHLDPEAPEPLHRDFVEVSVEPAHEPVCRLQKHDPGLDDGAPDGAPPQVPEEDGDLGCQLYPGRAPTGYGDREVSGSYLASRISADGSPPGFAKSAAQPEQIGRA